MQSEESRRTSAVVYPLVELLVERYEVEVEVEVEVEAFWPCVLACLLEKVWKWKWKGCRESSSLYTSQRR